MTLLFLSKRRSRAANLPTLSLIALLQRTPAVQMAATAGEFVLASPVASVLKPLAAIAASLGAMNSLAGATPLVPSAGSATGITVNAGDSVNVAYTVNGTQTLPQSWTVTGSFAPGLNFSGLTSNGGVNVTTLHLTGTPTTAGSYAVTIQAWEFSNGTGIGSPSYHYTVTVNGSAGTAPSFTTQPQSQTVNAGDTVTFTVAAAGDPAPTLQWKKGSTTLTGKTNATLTLNSVTSGDAGTYTCVATNSAGTATSNGATLTVNVPNVAPSFTTQPQSRTVDVGTTVTLTAAAAGTPKPTLQWRKDNVALSGQTGTSLVLNDVQTTSAGTYTCVATNIAGSATSQGAVLTVTVPTAAPSFTTQPQSESVSVGANVTFVVAVDGNPAPTLQWKKGDTALSGQTGTSLALTNVQVGDAGSYTVVATNSAGSTTSNAAVLTVNPPAETPTVSTQPQSQSGNAGGNLTLTAAVTGNPAPTLQWRHNGLDLAGATGASLALTNVQPANTGLYSLLATNTTATTASDFAIVGVLTTSAVIGTGTVLGSDIPHPNGNHYDQVLLTGPAAAIATQGGRVTRTSFIDENNDIVQVEFAGHGTLSLVLDDPSGPAVPVNYDQPTVNYMKGHVGLVIAGADETTNILVFTVGRATAFDGTGHYNILQAPTTPGGGGANDPMTNGSSLFLGHGGTVYDGFADIAFIAVASTNGKFGGLRASNTHFSAVNGLTGVYAPGVAFQGPVFIGDIDAGSVSATVYATPAIIIGSTNDARITGGDLRQSNGKPVQVHGLTQLKFTAGGDSGGNLFPALTNQAVLEDGGVDVTSQIVVNP